MAPPFGAFLIINKFHLNFLTRDTIHWEMQRRNNFVTLCDSGYQPLKLKDRLLFTNITVKVVAHVPLDLTKDLYCSKAIGRRVYYLLKICPFAMGRRDI